MFPKKKVASRGLVRVALAVTLISGVSAHATLPFYKAGDPYWDISSIENVEIPEPPRSIRSGRMEDQPQLPEQPPTGGIVESSCAKSTQIGTMNAVTAIGDISMIVDSIVNMGRQIWSIVAQGKPVVALKFDVGTALPKGANCWLDLESWDWPSSKTFKYTVKNGRNSEVIQFTYKVVYLVGGRADGKGRYIGYAGVQPVNLQVSWGYDFDVHGQVPMVFNRGTKTDPVAGMQILLSYVTKNSFKESQVSDGFLIDGTGQFKQMK